MSVSSCRHEYQDPLDHPESGPEDRYEGKLFATDHITCGRLEWGLYLYGREGQISGYLVPHQGRDFIDELAEGLLGDSPTPEECELVCDQGVIDDGYVRKLSHALLSTLIGSIG